jgi:hypothetical protein
MSSPHLVMLLRMEHLVNVHRSYLFDFGESLLQGGWDWLPVRRGLEGAMPVTAHKENAGPSAVDGRRRGLVVFNVSLGQIIFLPPAKLRAKLVVRSSHRAGLADEPPSRVLGNRSQIYAVVFLSRELA